MVDLDPGIGSDSQPWPTAPLHDLVEAVFVGLLVSRFKRAAGQEVEETPVLSVGDIEHGSVAPVEALGRVPLDIGPSESRFWARRHDVLLPARGSRLKVGLVEEDVRAVVTSTLVVVRPHAPGPREITGPFLAAVLQSPTYKALLNSMARHSTGTVSWRVEDIQRMEIPVPPRRIQDVIRDLVLAEARHHRLTLELARRRREEVLQAINKRLCSSLRAPSPRGEPQTDG